MVSISVNSLGRVRIYLRTYFWTSDCPTECVSAGVFLIHLWCYATPAKHLDSEMVGFDEWKSNFVLFRINLSHRSVFQW